ncbi:MAG: hypothetical protein FJ267_12320, partial [Planctomycetes bacterium]|nr:hypothetical protein [Planctomycetota bacterium]
MMIRSPISGCIPILFFLTSIAICAETTPLPNPNGQTGAATSSTSPSSTSSSGGLLINQVRQFELTFNTARNHFDKSEFGLAASLLERLLISDRESFVSTDDSTFSVRDAAWKLVEQLPTEIRRRVGSNLDRSAEADVTSSKNEGSTGRLALIAMRHRYSIPGLQIVRRLAMQYRDLSRHQLAATAFGQIAQHPRATISQQFFARVGQIESLVAAGQIENALTVCREIQKLPVPVEVSKGGNKITSGAWTS